MPSPSRDRDCTALRRKRNWRFTLRQPLQIARCTRILAEVAGKRPVGWVSPGGNHTAETMGILAEQGYQWWGDPCDDDPPYVESVKGRRIVVIPMTRAR